MTEEANLSYGKLPDDQQVNAFIGNQWSDYRDLLIRHGISTDLIDPIAEKLQHEIEGTATYCLLGHSASEFSPSSDLGYAELGGFITQNAIIATLREIQDNLLQTADGKRRGGKQRSATLNRYAADWNLGSSFKNDSKMTAPSFPRRLLKGLYLFMTGIDRTPNPSV